MKHPVIPFERQLNPGVDRNDPAAAVTAIELRFPQTFSERAWKVIRYFDGTMFLYAYKGRFVVTDESLELTECGDGTLDAPYGAPRWVGESMDELESWLLQIADEYDANGNIPGWEVDKSVEPAKTEGHATSPSILVKLVLSGEFIGVKTYSRRHGSHGRFLICNGTLRQLMDSSVGTTRNESDCGNYVAVTRMANALHFSFAWLNIYSDGSVKGIRQDITIPDLKIRSILDWSEAEKYLYTPPAPCATVDASHVARTIQKIMQNRQIRRAFSKAMRDCFRWPGEHITLYPDGEYSFLFTTKSGFPKNGGLILHEGTNNGYPYIYYSVHT